MAMNQDCIFCKIIAGEAESVRIWEDEDFIAIKNKFPEAPVDVLVMPKQHFEKRDLWENSPANIKTNGQLIVATYEVIKLLGLDKKGFRLIINGAGYNHLEHEHVHVLGELKNPKSNV